MTAIVAALGATRLSPLAIVTSPGGFKTATTTVTIVDKATGARHSWQEKFWVVQTTLPLALMPESSFGGLLEQGALAKHLRDQLNHMQRRKTEQLTLRGVEKDDSAHLGAKPTLKSRLNHSLTHHTPKMLQKQQHDEMTRQLHQQQEDNRDICDKISNLKRSIDETSEMFLTFSSMTLEDRCALQHSHQKELEAERAKNYIQTASKRRKLNEAIQSLKAYLKEQEEQDMAAASSSSTDSQRTASSEAKIKPMTDPT